MGMSRAQYVEFLKHLFPKGDAWNRLVTAQFNSLFESMAEEFVRFDQRVGTDLLNEVDPATTLELLEDWERIVDLPDDLQTELGATVGERQIDIIRKLSARGGQSRQFFIDLAALFGYTITITEIKPFRCGINTAGERCYQITWLHHWYVNSDSEISRIFKAGSGRAGDRLRDWANTTLENVITDKKPAQSTVFFTYG